MEGLLILSHRPYLWNIRETPRPTYTENGVMIVGSVYDQYGPCEVCGQPAGSPCRQLNRIRSGQAAHLAISVHPGRPLEQGN